MNTYKFNRILGLSLSTMALIILCILWISGHSHMSFIPLFIALLGTYFSNRAIKMK